MKNKLLKILSSILISTVLISNVNIMVKAEVDNTVTNIDQKLSFITQDIERYYVKDYDSTKLYITDEVNKRIAVINEKDKTENFIEVGGRPLKIILENNKIYVYIITKDNIPCVVQLNKETYKEEKRVNLEEVAYDVLVKNEVIYATTSKYSTISDKNHVVAYSINNGNVINKCIITDTGWIIMDAKVKLQYNEKTNSIYAISDTSGKVDGMIPHNTRGFKSFSIGNDGGLTEYSKNYIEDDYVPIMKINRSGTLFLHGSGNIYKSETPNDFMAEVAGKLETEFKYVEYSIDDKEAYLADAKGNINLLNMDTLYIEASTSVKGEIKYIYDNGDNIGVVYKASDSNTYIKNISKNSLNRAGKERIVGEIVDSIYDKNSNNIYMLDRLSRINIIDATKNKFIKYIQLDKAAKSMSISKDGQIAFILNDLPGSYNLFTEYNLQTGEKTEFYTDKYDPVNYKKIYINNGYIYILGNKKATKKVLIIKEDTFEEVQTSEEINEMDALTFSSTNDYVLGRKYSRAYKYRIENGNMVYDSENSYKSIGSPRETDEANICINEDLGVFYFGGVTVDINNLKNFSEDFTNNTRILNNQNTVLSGNYGCYILKRDLYLSFNNPQKENLRVLSVTADGLLYIVNEKNKLYTANPWEGDMNGDTNVDVLDISLIANQYNKISLESDYNIKNDINNDGIVDIYDLSRTSKLLDNNLVKSRSIEEKVIELK